MHLGYFSTAKAASEAYIKFKAAHIRDVAAEQSDRLLAEGLRSHAENLEKSLE